ncbi:MAG TPA: class I SAM-dependent methyltransferase [Stellaceae bacterium]|nr:class I SAM-dependent methyltransferase [Stellaceae bacterium]
MASAPPHEIPRQIPAADADAGSLLPALLDPRLDPLFWPAERRGVPSAWWGHVPFAHWLVPAIAPRLIVELGTHRGVSYAAFCQAVQRAGLDTRSIAVDTWEGEAHAGAYGQRVFDELRAFHDPRYGRFSTLLRATFDAARDRIDDGSVDLLHIDGFHTYDAVRHDFASWQPKLSDRAVVLFHDIAVRGRDFGVWRFWEELGARHPHFDFRHAFGLGVLAPGPQAPPAIAALCALNDTPDGDRLRERFALLGGRWEEEGERAALLSSRLWRLLQPVRALFSLVRRGQP